MGATQTRAYEMAQGLVRAGHQVTMIAEVPNHPTGIIPPEYRGKLYDRTDLDGIDVIRVWVKASPVKTFRTRIAFYLSYMVMAIVAGVFLSRGRYDLIYATSPPLFVGGAGLIVSYLRRIPLVFEVRDLWPESAILLGELNNKVAIYISSLLERWCYYRARQIVMVDNSKNRLLERGYPETKIHIIPNGANTDLYVPAPLNLALRKSLDIDTEHFVLIFTGLHGLAHDVETAVEAAALLRDHKDITFLFVGDGVRKPAMQDKVQRLGLRNFRFLPFQPEQELPNLISLANVGLSLGRKNLHSRRALPVKVFSYMACARPTLMAYDGDAADLLRDSGAGLVVEPENPEALADAILQLKDDPVACQQMGENGRELVVRNYSRQAQAGQLIKLLEQAAGNQPVSLSVEK